MTMRKCVFALVSILFLVSSFAFASETEDVARFSEIERLWQKCEENSEDIFSARQNLEYYRTALNTSRVLYPLAFSLSVTPDFYKNYEQYSDELELGTASATLTQTLPGGAKVSAGASYGISSGYRNWNSTDGYTDKGYSDYFSAQVQYSQSLNPYWINGESTNPAKEKLLLAAATGENNYIQAKKNTYSKVLSLYIQFRRNKRNLLIMEKQVELLHLNLESLKKMHVSNAAFLSDVWQAEKSLGEAKSSLNSYVLEKEEIIRSLSLLCGADLSLFDEESLPENQTQLFDTDPFLSNMEIQMQVLKGQFLIDRQDSAPVLSFSASFKETSRLKEEISSRFHDGENYLHWSAGVSAKINNLYGGEDKLYKKKYETERSKYEKQIDDYKKRIFAEKLYYDNLISSYEENVRNAVENETNEKENYEGIKKLYENGQKRQIDVFSAEINYLRQKHALENLRDALWQAKWIRTQFSD